MERIDLTPEIMDLLNQGVEVRKFKAGELIVQVGMKDFPFYVIRKGRCEVFIKDRLGGAIVLDELTEGMCFGEMSKLTHRESNANVRAKEDVELYALGASHFEDILSEVPTVARKLYHELCHRLENMNLSLKTKVDELLDFNARLERKIMSQVRDLEQKNSDLARQNEELSRITQQRDDFLNMAVHDMRSPLGNILGFVDLLREHDKVRGEADLSKVIRVIERQARTMLELINDILDISKIHSGKLEITLLPCDVPNLLKEAQVANQLLAQGKGIEIILQSPASLPKVQGDIRRLMEILNNLISNAIKYSARARRVWLGAESHPGEVRIYVRDEGQGIPEREIPKLFAMFQQLSPRPTEGERGSGLGLAIAQKLVHLHKGRIWAESVLGKGSTFWIGLPPV